MPLYDKNLLRIGNSLPKNYANKHKYIDNTFDENITMFNLNDSVE